MFKAIVRISIASLVFCWLLNPSLVRAQLAPTSTASISGAILDSTGKPIDNARITIIGPRTVSTKSDGEGRFVVIGLPFGKYTISVFTASFGTATRSNILVQDDIDIAIQYASTQGLKTIAQVSSATNASFNVSPVSITSVNPLQHAFEGQTSWRTLLEQIPGVTTGAAGDNISLAGYALPDGPFVPLLVSLNGALPYETAPMLDNMPLIGQSSIGGGGGAGLGTDLSLYPLNGFANADIVRGPGAAAPSIVDSIGGTFILRSPGEVTKNHFELSLSTDPYGGIVANGLAEMRWNRLSAVVTYGVNDSPGPISTRQIPAITYPYAINGSPFLCGPPTCSFGFGGAPGYQFFNGSVQTGIVGCCIPEDSAWTQHSGSIGLTYDLSSRISAGVFYSGQQSRQNLIIANFTTTFSPAAGYNGSLAPGVYAFPDISGDEYLAATSSLLEEKISVGIGAGLLRVTALQNRTYASQNENKPATSFTQQLYGGGIVGGVPMIFNGGTYTLTSVPFALQYNAWSSNRDLALSYTTSLGDNAHAAISFVKSYYNNPELLNEFLGITPTLGFNYSQSIPVANSETTNEMRLLVGGDPTPKTSIDLSMYFVGLGYHVQDPNDPTGATYADPRFTYAAPRLGFVWRPSANLAVRASAGGGFAEAPLCYLFGSNGIPQLNSTSTAYSATLTNLNLQPEKSFAFDLGTDLRLKHNTLLSFDVYRANLYAQVYQSTSQTGTFNGLPLYTTQYRNLGVSRMEGILVDLHHDIGHGLYWHAAAGLTRGYLVSVPAGFYDDPSQPCTNCINGYVVPNINFNGWFEASVPYSQASGTLGYRWAPAKFIEIAPTYYGPNNSYYRPAFVEIDGRLGYPLTKNITLLATLRNITGIYDRSVQTLSPVGIIGAPAISGPAYALYGQEYGPRTLILTTNFSL